MHKGLHFFFQVISVLRFLAIPMIFIIDWMRHNSIPDTGTFTNMEIGLDISSWEYLLIYTVIIIFPLNTILGLLISFQPKWKFQDFLRSKTILQVLYGLELAMLPVLLYLVYVKIQDNFYPPEPSTYIGLGLEYLLPGEVGVSKYEKIATVNLCVLVFCSLIFVLLFWKFYTERKKQLHPVISK